MIQGLILDYGGVVMHEDPADYDAIGLPRGLARGELWALVHAIPEYRPSRVGAISGERFERAVETRMVQRMGATTAAAAIAALRALYRDQAPVRAAMQPLLASLRGRVKLALLSNGTRGSTRRLGEKGLSALFDAILCSGDTGLAKPDPAAYRLAARQLGLATTACAFVDDVEENVAAARTLGMPALHYHHVRHHELVQALADWGRPLADVDGRQGERPDHPA